MIPLTGRVAWALQSGIIPRGTRVDVFSRIYEMFLLLGTLVGIVVLGYMCWNAYKYRESGSHATDGDDERPSLGEVPTGGGKGKKLFLSFALSAVIVISLILWTYGTLLYVEASPGPSDEEVAQGDPVEVTVIGHQFYWEFVYENGYSTKGSGVMRVPANREIELRVTSADVFHNFGIPELRVKSDSIPGHTTETWFVAPETRNYSAACFELCGQQHSYMDATVVAMEPDEYEQWYANTTSNTTPMATPTEAGHGAGGGEGESHA
ncbi:cytochrome c oxidase subunit II [Haloglomus litoreum]|uniref:cytochrome c oxidase subunit II n=1 Tax=Haloglomus litoreum TaxID=3034026 RepID=UPI0023E7A0D0|nr:cytochrome c oxidase subunit II [Haloglomus sp. DT116]